MSEAARVGGLLGGKRSGGAWLAKCPIHDDRTASLSIKDGNDELLLFCHAGCNVKDIFRDLVQKGILESRKRFAPIPDAKFKRTFHHELVGEFTCAFPDSPHYDLVTIYPYRDGGGRIYKFKARLTPKTFRWFHFDDRNDLKWGEGKGIHYPYRWDEVLAAIHESKTGGKSRVLHIPEGEKDADTLANDYGLLSMTPGGVTSGFDISCWDELAKIGKVVIWADNDANDKGHKRAQELALNFYNRGCTVKVVMTQNHKDISDWRQAGATVDDVTKLLVATKEWKPASEQLQAAVKAGTLVDSKYDLGTPAWGGDQFAGWYWEKHKYVADVGEWMHFDGRVWVADHAEKYRETVKNMHLPIKKVQATLDPIFQKALDKLIREVQTDKGVRQIAAMARSCHNININKNDIDSRATAHLFNCASGLINLITGKVMPHGPAHLIAKQSPYKVDMDRDPQWFIQFLHELMAGNSEIVRYMQFFFGYCLSGDTRFQRFILMTGAAGSGKSQLLDILSNVLGDYNGTLSADSLYRAGAQRSPGVDSDLASTMGARLVVAHELAENIKLDEQVIKALTGGDPVKVKFMRQDRFPLQTNAKLIFTANERPFISDDRGIARRLMEIKFEKAFADTGAEKMGLAKQILEAEGPQILGWLVKGAMECYRTDFAILQNLPEKIVEWSEDYVNESDSVHQWTAEYVTNSVGGWVSSGAMFESFQRFCKVRRLDVGMTSRGFGRRLSRLGFESGKNLLDQRGWKGVKLMED